ncbi:MAG: hypothetical protein C0415_02100 [Thermodesulfovibrio sp.]|nr:hypothetical protein [Thermodesulfovibrio sp.]
MKTRDERGFTLVELLIVIAIIAILAAIAIPQFSAYRERGIRATMISDARNAATQMEALFADNQSYAAALAFTQTGPGRWDLDQVVGVPEYLAAISSMNTLTVPVATAAAWTITVANPAAGVGFSPLTYTSAGACTWATGGNC